jgi:hypothetical protein
MMGTLTPVSERWRGRISVRQDQTAVSERVLTGAFMSELLLQRFAESKRSRQLDDLRLGDAGQRLLASPQHLHKQKKESELANR